MRKSRRRCLQGHRDIVQGCSIKQLQPQRLLQRRTLVGLVYKEAQMSDTSGLEMNGLSEFDRLNWPTLIVSTGPPAQPRMTRFGDGQENQSGTI
jgi:hypothetical protein